MRNIFLPLLILSLISCAPSVDAPRSMCEIPKNFQGWIGSNARWNGVLIGDIHHGFSLFSYECRERGVQIILANENAKRKFFTELNRADILDFIETDMSGKITRNGFLVDDIHTIRIRKFEKREGFDFLNTFGSKAAMNVNKVKK